MTDYTEPSDVDIHASPETVQDYIHELEAHRDELDALLNEGIATDADTRQQARNDALREAAEKARTLWVCSPEDIEAAILALIDAPAPDHIPDAGKEE